MDDENLPALYRSANDLSLESQREFLLALSLHLVLLVIISALNSINVTDWKIPALQLIFLLMILFCSIYLYSKRPDRAWYSGRAVAESIKTMAWRYVSRAEPFHVDDNLAKSEFRNRIKYVIEQNKDVAKLLTTNLDKPQITDKMNDLRRSSLFERKNTYRTNRIDDQLSWYAKKSSYNRRLSDKFFWALIFVNFVAVVLSVVKIGYIDFKFWPIDILVAISASILSWMQAKRYSELASSYALAAHEIGLIREYSESPATDSEFSQFVGDAENAFSREHTQWVARQDN